MKTNRLLFGLLVLGAVLIAFAVLSVEEPQQAVAQTDNGCLSCHEGIESIRPPDAPMMMALEGMGGGVWPVMVEIRP